MMTPIQKAEACGKAFFKDAPGMDDSYPEISDIVDFTEHYQSGIDVLISGLKSFALPTIHDFVSDLSIINYRLGGLDEEMDKMDEFAEMYMRILESPDDSKEIASEYDFSDIVDKRTYELPLVLSWWDKLTGKENTVSGLGSVFFVVNPEAFTLLEVDVHVDFSTCKMTSQGSISCFESVVEPTVHVFDMLKLDMTVMKNFISQRLKILELEYAPYRQSFINADKLIRSTGGYDFDTYPDLTSQELN